jgi:hypothetical protein
MEFDLSPNGRFVVAGTQVNCCYGIERRFAIDVAPRLGAVRRGVSSVGPVGLMAGQDGFLAPGRWRAKKLAPATGAPVTCWRLDLGRHCGDAPHGHIWRIGDPKGWLAQRCRSRETVAVGAGTTANCVAYRSAAMVRAATTSRTYYNDRWVGDLVWDVATANAYRRFFRTPGGTPRWRSTQNHVASTKRDHTLQVIMREGGWRIAFPPTAIFRSSLAFAIRRTARGDGGRASETIDVLADFAGGRVSEWQEASAGKARQVAADAAASGCPARRRVQVLIDGAPVGGPKRLPADRIASALARRKRGRRRRPSDFGAAGELTAVRLICRV